MDRFEASISRWRVLLLIGGALGFVALGFWFVFGREHFSLMAVIAGWASMIFFGLCGAIGVRQLFRTAPVIDIDRSGLLWRRWSDERIPWDAFERAAPMRMDRHRFLCFWLCDPARYRSTHLLGRLAGANKAMGFGDITLSAGGTNRSFYEVVEAVHRFAPELFDWNTMNPPRNGEEDHPAGMVEAAHLSASGAPSTTDFTATARFASRLRGCGMPPACR